LSQIQNRTGDRKAAVEMAFEPDQNDRRAEVKRLSRHLQRVRAAKETVDHAQTVDLCRQAAETPEPGKDQNTPWTFKKMFSGLQLEFWAKLLTSERPVKRFVV
jgi:hypothetical protein